MFYFSFHFWRLITQFVLVDVFMLKWQKLSRFPSSVGISPERRSVFLICAFKTQPFAVWLPQRGCHSHAARRLSITASGCAVTASVITRDTIQSPLVRCLTNIVCVPFPYVGLIIDRRQPVRLIDSVIDFNITWFSWDYSGCCVIQGVPRGCYVSLTVTTTSCT
jgi:hypothetical protein